MEANKNSINQQPSMVTTITPKVELEREEEKIQSV